MPDLFTPSPTGGLVQLGIVGGSGEGDTAVIPFGSNANYGGALKVTALLEKSLNDQVGWYVGPPAGYRVTVQDSYLAIQQVDGSPLDSTIAGKIEVFSDTSGYGTQLFLPLDPADTDHVFWYFGVSNFTLDGTKTKLVIPATGRYLLTAVVSVSELEAPA